MLDEGKYINSKRLVFSADSRSIELISPELIAKHRAEREARRNEGHMFWEESGAIWR